MSIFSLTVTPNNVGIELQANTGLFQSPLINSAQVIDRAGMKWGMSLLYRNLSNDKRAELMALLAQLRGSANQLRVPVYDNPARGAYGGTPLVDGGGQTGNTLNIDGCTPSVAQWIRRGDYFSIEVNGEHELKMATADAASNGAGEVVLTFEPRLRASPLFASPIYVQDGVLPRPFGVFRLAGQTNGWSSQPGVTTKRTSLTLSLVEDVFATQ